MNIPALNIVMAFDHKVIDTLRASQDLGILENKLKTQSSIKPIDILIFRNGPASHFLSLNHQYAWGGGSEVGSSMRLEIEFIDPEGTFEKGLLTNDLNSNMPPNARMGSEELERLEANLAAEIAAGEDDAIKGRLLQGQVLPPSVFTKKLREELKLSERGQVAAQVEMTKFNRVLDAVGGIENFNKLRLLEQQAAQNSLTQRPVWITYGAGNDFRDWSPVMCFEKALEMQYNWTGEGVRKLKIVYDGVGISPNLTSMGITPLGALGIGMVLKGQSNPLFDEDASKEEYKAYVEAGEEYEGELSKIFSDPTSPSPHKVITEVIKNYIITGTSYENVVVAFPDLDVLLGKSKKKSLENAKKQVPPTYFGNIKNADLIRKYSIGTLAWKDFIETFGLRLVESSKTGFQLPVGVDDLRLEEVAGPDLAPDYFKSKVYRTVLSSDGMADLLQQNRFITPLSRVVNKITKTIIDDGGLKVGATFRTEHDYDMLKTMHKYGMIKDPRKPALIYGDPFFINKYIYARINNEVSPPVDASAAPSIDPVNLGKANVVDKVMGFNEEYTKAIEEIINPTPWASPFGPTGDVPGVDDFSLEKDTNIVIDSVKDLSKKEKLKLLIFTLGTKNTNILSINFNLNNQYLSLINSFTYQTTTAAQYMTAILPKGKVTACKGVLSDIQKMQLKAKGNEIPEGFKKLIRPWLVTTKMSDTDKESLAAWGKIFESLGIQTKTAQERKADADFRFDLEQEADQSFHEDYKVDSPEEYMIRFYWDRFKAMTKEFPRPVIEMNGSTVSKSTINHANMVADGMAQHAFTGSMKTLPMFHLANSLSVVGRDVLLYCVEPRIVGLADKDVTIQQTWFSGMYNLTGGFKHTISGGEASSEFKFVRAPGRSMTLGKAKV